MSQNGWSAVVDGTAVGPTREVRIGDDATATLTALWSDAEGVVVEAEIPSDSPMQPDAAARLAAALTELAAITPPTVSRTTIV